MDETTAEALRQRLGELDAEIADLRRTSADVKGHVGPHGDGVEDSEEIATDLTSLEEQDAVIGVLLARREAVVEQLKQLGQ